MRIGLLRHQQPFAEYVNNNWRVWYIFNNDVSSGTYFDLRNDGICDRVTIQDHEVTHIDRVSTPLYVGGTTTTPPVENYDEREREHSYIVGASL